MKLGLWRQASRQAGSWRGRARLSRVLVFLAGCGGAGLAAAQLMGGCQQSPTLVPVRSLQQSGKVSFVCLSPVEPAERPLAECTAQTFSSICQYEYQTDAGTLDADVARNDAGVPVATLLPHLYALVTQTLTGEVAVVDTSSQSNYVLDENPLEPGADFLHVGAQPTGIASTPGSVATFVGVAEIGRAGLFAIPSSKIRPASAFGVPDDCTGNSDGGAIQPPQLTSWPACSLPSAPGDILLINDPARSDGSLRTSCDGLYAKPDPNDKAFQATITYREGTPGRAKLVVAFPALGGIGVFDAQELLDRPAGAFDACTIERWVPLEVDIAGLAQEPPLPTPTTVCRNPKPNTQPLAAPCPPDAGPGETDGGTPSCYRAQPSGLSYADGKLYVADISAPEIHVIDMHGAGGVPTPCNPIEQAPLLPTSADNPARVVFASKVAAAPTLTPDFKRYLYATDVDDASAMIFDIGPDSTTRRPLQRAHPEWDPFSPRDRVKFTAPPADIIIVQRDVPNIDPVTGLAAGGVLCNPDPNALSCDVESHNCDPGVAYRTSPDFTIGAGPLKLRGEFAFAALTNGRVGVIDIADFDAPCRAPAFGSELAGCTADSQLNSCQLNVAPPPPVYTTTEISCNVVAPGEARASTYQAAGLAPGNHVPGILTFPQLFQGDGSVVTPGGTSPIPQMVATLPANIPDACTQRCDRLSCGGTCDVEPGCPLQTFVGGSLTPLYTGSDASGGTFADCVIPDGQQETTCNGQDQPSGGGTLVSGSLATNNALVMNLEDPRAHAGDDTWTVSFEGALPGFNTRLAYLTFPPAPAAARLADPNSRFCDLGVLGRAAMADLLTDQGKAAADVPGLADGFADYVQITNPIPDSTDAYWTGPAASCDPSATYGTCFDVFGSTDVVSLDPHRDLRILEAYQDHVDVEARHPFSASQNLPPLLNLLRCCFPSALTFNVRTGNQWAVVGAQFGFLHHVVADADTGVCRNACDGALQRRNGRLIGSATGPLPDRLPGDHDPSPSFMNPMFRFGIVVGSTPLDPAKFRDYQFRFNTNNSFLPLLVPLNTDPTVLVEPRGMGYLPATQELAVTDGSFSGLIMVSLSTSAVSRSFF